ncbi:hypothetical protein D9M70_222630 [compost metagenome]
MQLLAHGVQHEGDAAGLGLEQVLEGRALMVVLGAGEAGAFEEVEDAHRVFAELGTGAARGFQVLALLLRVPGQVGLGVALHEGEVQRPPAQADHRHPDQLLFQEEAQQADAAIEQVLQHQDVDPALMVAGDQVAVLVVQPGQPVHVPARVAHQAHPQFVAADPGLGDEAGRPVQHAPGGAEGQQQLQDGDGEQRDATEQGVEGQQQGRQHTAQGGRDKTQHEGLQPRRGVVMATSFGIGPAAFPGRGQNGGQG